MSQIEEKNISSLFLPDIKIISWNLLYKGGATLDDVVFIINNFHPDILLMQEALPFLDELPKIIPGQYSRSTLINRPYGPACWSRIPFFRPPLFPPIPSSIIIRRRFQILRFHTESTGLFTIANVHLSHGQILNRRQLRKIRTILSERAIIIGDFNSIGPTPLKGFKDVGPRMRTHKMLNHIPLRLDRCCIRGFKMINCAALDKLHSDHRPILITLKEDDKIINKA